MSHAGPGAGAPGRPGRRDRPRAPQHRPRRRRGLILPAERPLERGHWIAVAGRGGQVAACGPGDNQIASRGHGAPGVLRDPPSTGSCTGFGDPSPDPELLVRTREMVYSCLRLRSDLDAGMDEASRRHAIQILSPPRDPPIPSGVVPAAVDRAGAPRGPAAHG